MINELESTTREKIHITSGYFKRNKIRKALKAIEFFETTKYIQSNETKNRFYSNFDIVVCGEKSLVDRIMILLAALGDT
jgi:hypothetical protein